MEKEKTGDSVSWEATARVQVCRNNGKNEKKCERNGKDKLTRLSDEENVQRLASLPQILIPSYPAHHPNTALPVGGTTE